MANITKHIENLPATIEELQQFVKIGKEKHKARLAVIEATKSLQDAKEQKEQLLDLTITGLIETWLAHAKLGELLGSGEASMLKGKADPTQTYVGSDRGEREHARRFYDALVHDEKILEAVVITLEEQRKPPAYYKPVNELRKLERKKLIDDIRKQAIYTETGPWDVLIIDPPWPYGTKYDPQTRRGTCPYPEMDLEEITEMKDSPIEKAAKKDCILWLWTTHKFMRHSFDILDAWGFRDVAILTWVKDRMGTGSWLRSQSEFCIMAVKGKPIHQLTNQTTLLRGPLRKHSQKPEEFYEMVKGLCPGTIGEYFPRTRRPGIAPVLSNELE